VLESLREKARGQSETELRTLLGAFLFEGDDVFKPVSVLSGGEKSRLALARTLLRPANFLILDEPTNHLDMQSIGVLIEALQQYGGSFVVVSHDRHFLDEVANGVWHVGDGRVDTFDGSYSEYEWHRDHGTAARLAEHRPDETQASDGADGQDAHPQESTSSSGPKTKAQKRREAEERRRRYEALQNGTLDDYSLLNAYQLRQKVEEAEAAILEKEDQQAALEAALADPALYDDADEARATTQEYETIQQDLAALYETWETLAEHLAAQE
jgi:ATP-binding cassette subfamily F protein 3